MKKGNYTGLLPFLFATWLLLALVAVFSWNPVIGQGYISPGAIIPGTNTYFLQSGATYADWFDLFGTANTFTTTQTIDPGTDVDGFNVDMPSANSSNALLIEYNSGNRIYARVFSNQTSVTLGNSDLGNDVAGPYVQIGRNANSTQESAGSLRLVDLGGTTYYLHADDNGNARFGTTAPIGSEDTTNAILGGDYVGDGKQATYSGTPNTTAWPDLLNVASGSGYLDEVICATDNDDANVAYSGEDCNVRITVDGGSAQTLNDFRVGLIFSADDVQLGYDSSSNIAYAGRRIIFGGLRFDSSLLVEVNQDDTDGDDLYAICHYREDQ